MWLFTTVGFFSVVQKPNDAFLTVRARVAEDLIQLQAKYMPELSEVIVGAGSDYPYRATIGHEDFARGLAQIARDIHYDNFKNEVSKEDSAERVQIYSQVWKILMELENEPVYPPSVTGERKRAWKRRAFGGIVINKQSKVLLKEPRDHFGGIVWTFPKGSCHADETPELAIIREVEEETGIIGRIELQIPDAFESETTLNSYFLMSFERETDWKDIETLRIRWANQEEAEKLIGMTTSEAAREQDLAALKLAYQLHRESPE